MYKLQWKKLGLSEDQKVRLLEDLTRRSRDCIYEFKIALNYEEYQWVKDNVDIDVMESSIGGQYLIRKRKVS